MSPRASNYPVGGINQTHFFAPNWSSNGQTVTMVPSLESIKTVIADPPDSKPAHMVPDRKAS